MSSLFHTVLTRPLFNALIGLYNTISFEDLGIAIIILTILVRFLLYPLFYKGLRNQALMQKIQPELNEVKEKYKEDKEKQALEMMALWKKYEINPFSGFLLLLVQLPVLLAIYRVFLSDFSPELFEKELYSFVDFPNNFSQSFLGFIDLSSTSMVLLLITVVAVFLQTRVSLGKGSNGVENKMAKNMSYIMPVIMFVFLINFSAAISLYILVTTIFSIFQQRIINARLEKHGTKGA